MQIPLDERPKTFGRTFSNDNKYFDKWHEKPVAPQILDVTISEDTEPSIEKATEDTYNGILSLLLQKNKDFEIFPGRSHLTFLTFA